MVCRCRLLRTLRIQIHLAKHYSSWRSRRRPKYSWESEEYTSYIGMRRHFALTLHSTRPHLPAWYNDPHLHAIEGKQKRSLSSVRRQQEYLSEPCYIEESREKFNCTKKSTESEVAEAGASHGMDVELEASRVCSAEVAGLWIIRRQIGSRNLRERIRRRINF